MAKKPAFLTKAQDAKDDKKEMKGMEKKIMSKVKKGAKK